MDAVVAPHKISGCRGVQSGIDGVEFVAVLKPDPNRVVTEVHRKVYTVDFAERHREIPGFGSVEIIPRECKMTFAYPLFAGREDFPFQASSDVGVLIEPTQDIEVLVEISSVLSQIPVEVLDAKRRQTERRWRGKHFRDDHEETLPVPGRRGHLQFGLAQLRAAHDRVRLRIVLDHKTVAERGWHPLEEIVKDRLNQYEITIEDFDVATV